MIKVVATRTFDKTVKKLHENAKKDLDNAVKYLIENPLVGVQKKGDLSGVLVYKFKMIKQLTLLAYTYDEDVLVLTLLMLGSHQNFYRDLKTTNIK